MSKTLYIKVPASTGNLGSGFDCAGMSLNIYNEFFVGKSKRDKIELKNNRKNGEEIFLRAFKKGLKYTGENFCVNVKVIDRIPIKKGLGSSGTAILSGLISAFKLSGKRINRKEILKIAFSIEGHIDNIASSLFGGFTIASIENENVEVLKFPVDKSLRIVIFIPDFTISTEKARKLLPEKIPLSDVVYNLSRFGFLCTALIKNELSYLQIGTKDRIHQIYREKLIPYLSEFIEKGIKEGAYGGCLSGAGSSIVLFTDKKFAKKLQIRMEEYIKKKNLKGKIEIFSSGGPSQWKFLR